MAHFRKKNDNWFFYIESKDDNGKRKQISKGPFKTKKEAVQAAADVQLKLAKNEYFEVKAITLKDYLIHWLNNYAKQNLKASSAKNRKHMIDSRIIPAIGHIEVHKLKVFQVIQFYNEMLESGLSSSYVNTIHRLLKNALKMAVKWQFATANIMDQVDAPRISKKPVKTWNKEQVKEFLEATKEAYLYTAFVIALTTGMRRGEILNLKWSNVDLKNAKIIVTGETKTKSSQRTITIPQLLIDVLKKQKVKQLEWRLAFGAGFMDQDYVLSAHNGNRIMERNLNRSFTGSLKKLPHLPQIRFHDLRHTHATILLKLGENPKIVSERLGHSRVNITLDTYSHVLPDMQLETARKLNDLLS